MGNMYSDAKQIINPTYGCYHDCIYCKKSYKRQAKRQKHRCMKCYNFEVHEHLDRLNKTPKKTEGDEFIWISAFGDICFAKKEWIERIIEFIKKYHDRTFFLQTKNPYCFYEDFYGFFPLPENLILGITLETNQDEGYKKISKAIPPVRRTTLFSSIPHHRKFVTIEPILDFQVFSLLYLIEQIKPERIYIGYDTKKCDLPEPSVRKTRIFIDLLREKGYYVKEKYISNK